MKAVKRIRRAEICVDEECGHESCAQARADARAKCVACSKYILGRPYLDSPDGPGVVHHACIEREYKKPVVKAVFIRDRWYRLELSCKHITFVKSTTGRHPKVTRCSECKYTVRDEHGNRRLMSMNTGHRSPLEG